MARPPETWSEQHRLVLSVLAGATAVMLAFGFLSLGKAIKSPFEPKGPGRFLSLDEQEKQQEAAEKVRDTDGDGLSDWDETRVWHTSPFLADTDSDGLTDGTEVKTGDDPNCPKGRTCPSSAAYAAPPAQANPENLLPNEVNPFLGADLFGAYDPSVLAGFDAKKVRELLKSSGVSDQQLSEITDDELRQIYEDALRDQVPTSSLTSIRERAEAATGTP